jgi:trimethylamine:corrinoid methyltransferase-like protein
MQLHAQNIRALRHRCAGCQDEVRPRTVASRYHRGTVTLPTGLLKSWMAVPLLENLRLPDAAAVTSAGSTTPIQEAGTLVYWNAETMLAGL